MADRTRHSEIVRLGRPGVRATRLGLGTAPLGGMFSSVADADAIDVVIAAAEAGIELFDTAPLYGNGVAERRLGAGLAAVPAHRRSVSTKVGRVLVPGLRPAPGIYVDAAAEQPVFDFSAAAVRASFESSLERLGVDRVDIVFIHDADDHEEQALQEAYPELERMRRAGLVDAIGVAMDTPRIPARFVRETDIDLVLIAGRFTLLDQSARDELLPAAYERGVSVVAAGVFNSGILANPRPGATYEYEPASAELIARAQAMSSIAGEFGVPLTAVALQFPLRHPAIAAVLTGARSVDELRANIADFNRVVPDDCWAALEDAGFIPPATR